MILPARCRACNAQPVRIGSVRRDELPVGGRGCLKLLVFSKAGWQRHDLGALSWRQQITPWQLRSPCEQTIVFGHTVIACLKPRKNRLFREPPARGFLDRGANNPGSGFTPASQPMTSKRCRCNFPRCGNMRRRGSGWSPSRWRMLDRE